MTEVSVAGRAARRIVAPLGILRQSCRCQTDCESPTGHRHFHPGYFLPAASESVLDQFADPLRISASSTIAIAVAVAGLASGDQTGAAGPVESGCSAPTYHFASPSRFVSFVVGHLGVHFSCSRCSAAASLNSSITEL